VSSCKSLIFTKYRNLISNFRKFLGPKCVSFRVSEVYCIAERLDHLNFLPSILRINVPLNCQVACVIVRFNELGGCCCGLFCTSFCFASTTLGARCDFLCIIRSLTLSCGCSMKLLWYRLIKDYKLWNITMFFIFFFYFVAYFCFLFPCVVLPFVITLATLINVVYFEIGTSLSEHPVDRIEQSQLPRECFLNRAGRKCKFRFAPNLPSSCNLHQPVISIGVRLK